MKHLAKLGLMLLICTSINAQTEDFNDFNGIKSRGSIPKDFTVSWADKYYDNPVELELSEVGFDEVSLEEFWINQNHAIDVLLNSGKFSFGDPVTEYINKVGDKVLSKRPELRSKVRFYIYREPSANAFCVADGLIAVTTGLMANIKSEAELAFVLAHEVAHFQEEHIFEDYFADDEAEDDDADLDLVSSVEKRMKRSKSQELEADRIGLEIFLESGYDTTAARRSLITLYESYHPVGRCKIEGNPFAYRNNYQLPEWAQKSFNEPILEDYDYLALGHGHPNVADRIEAIQEELNKSEISQSNTSLYLVGESEFNTACEWARFENIRMNVLEANYSEALYEIYCLEKGHPKNSFLEMAKLRSLYGLAAFKIRERYFQVVNVPSDVPGPYKDLTYPLFSFNKFEMLGVALRYTNDMLIDNPANQDIRLIQRNLHRMLYSHSMMDTAVLMFQVDTLLPQRTYQFLSEILPEYSKANSQFEQDFNADAAYRDSVLNFVLEEIREDEFDDREDYLYYMNNYVMDINFDGLYILDPIVFVSNRKADEKDRLNSLDCEESLMEDLPEIFTDLEFKGAIFHTSLLSEAAIKDFNRLSDLKLYRDEARIWRSVGFPSARTNIGAELDIDYPFVVTILGLIRAEGKDYYYFNVTDLRNGLTMAQQIGDEGEALLPIDFVRSTKKNLKALVK